MKSIVAFAGGNNRSDNIEKVLHLLGDEIDLHDKSRLVIKVNFVMMNNQLAATHVDGVRTLLRFIRRQYDGDIAICEGTLGPARNGFETYGYLDLVDEFGVELVDLNQGTWKMLNLYKSDLSPMRIHFSRQLMESDYLISIGPPKTHDFVVATMSIKNIVMGGVSFTHDDKSSIHQGHAVMNLNLALMAMQCRPHLAVIDGLTGMEGEGPGLGDKVDFGIAAAGCDPVAVDCFTARLMGFDIDDIGYLWYLKEKGVGAGDPEDIEILGDDPEPFRRRFEPHSAFAAQKKWRDDRVRAILDSR